MHVLLSLGSNLGNRARNLRRALDEIAGVPGTRVTAESDVYETAPWGKVDQPVFYNMAAAIETECNPLELLGHAKAIEKALGRVSTEKWGPRLIDIDLILWGSTIVDEAGLRIPHPGLRDRGFVLRPLAEIAPDFRDPESGKPMEELAAPYDAGAGLRRIGPLDTLIADSK